jgi:hypothetical protein
MYASYPSWWMKVSPRRRRSIGKRKFRWEMLGLQDPAESSSTPSIEDVRRQIVSASHHGLSPNTLARSHKEQKRTKSRLKASRDTRKRGVASQ